MLDVASLISGAREEHVNLRSSLVETAMAAKSPRQLRPPMQAWALKSDLNLSGNGPTKDCPLKLCTSFVNSARVSSPSESPAVCLMQASKSGRAWSATLQTKPPRRASRLLYSILQSQSQMRLYTIFLMIACLQQSSLTFGNRMQVKNLETQKASIHTRSKF